jgi:hypothetical protein
MYFIKASKTPVFSTTRQETFWKTISDNTKITDLIFWTFKKLPAPIHPRETFRLTKEENAPSYQGHELREYNYGASCKK